MREPTIVGKVIIEYLEKFPHTSSLGLARIIYRDNVAIFRDVEHARERVRYYRNATGKIKRSYTLSKYGNKYERVQYT